MDWDLIKLKFSGLRISVRMIEQFIIGTFYVGCVVVGCLFVAWQYFQPYFHKLENKDAFRYERISKDISSFHWIRAYQQVRELEAISMEELYGERYGRFQVQFGEDKTFRKDILKKRKEDLEQFRNTRLTQHQDQIHDIHYTNRLTGFLAQRIRWGMVSPWERGLILRDKCKQFVEEEKENWLKKFQEGLSAQPSGSFEGTRLDGLTAAEFCESLIPLRHEEKFVTRALQSMKDHLSYFQFLRLLKEIGVKEEEVFDLPSRLNRMTADIGGT